MSTELWMLAKVLLQVGELDEEEVLLSMRAGDQLATFQASLRKAQQDREKAEGQEQEARKRLEEATARTAEAVAEEEAAEGSRATLARVLAESRRRRSSGKQATSDCSAQRSESSRAWRAVQAATATITAESDEQMGPPKLVWPRSDATTAKSSGARVARALVKKSSDHLCCEHIKDMAFTITVDSPRRTWMHAAGKAMSGVDATSLRTAVHGVPPNNQPQSIGNQP